jgi:hypothetical protein
MRRDQAKTPPKPDSEIAAKAMKISPSVGRTCGGGDGKTDACGSAALGVGAGELIGSDEVMSFVYRPSPSSARRFCVNKRCAP